MGVGDAADVDELARLSYAHGWALSGGPMTDRVRAGCVLAVEHVRHHGPTRAVLEATMRLGSLEGTWASVMDRREALYAKHTDDTLDAWRALIDSDGVDDAVDTYRTRAAPTVPEPDQQAKDRRRAEAIAAAIAFLYAHANPGDPHYQALILTVADAIRTAEAEGWAGAVAVAAEQLGHTGVNFDRAYTDALARVAANPGTAYGQAEGVVADIIRGGATDIAGVLARSDTETDAVDVADEVRAAIEAGRSPSLFLDQAMGAAFARGALAFFTSAGVPTVSFVTVGDDRVCAECDTLEAGSPYTLDQAPDPPIHPRCRCVLVSDDPIASVGSTDLDRYVDGGDA